MREVLQTTLQDAPQCRIKLFGQFSATVGSEPLAGFNKARLQALLAYLILNSPTPQSRELLAFTMWPDSEEAQARTNLRQLLHHLRHALPPQCSSLSVDHHAVQWRTAAGCTVDTIELDATIDAARGAAASGDEAAEQNQLTLAADIYTDDLLVGVYDEWLRPKRDHYRQIATRTFERLSALLVARRDYAAAVRYAERLIAMNPLREAHYQLLIRLHANNNDRASAIRTYHQCMRTLRRELGVDPDPVTRQLFEQTLKKETPADTAPASVRKPAPSSETVAPLVGRKPEWRQLVECWNDAAQQPSQLLLICGEPGIGKSRFAQEFSNWCRQRSVSIAWAHCYRAQGKLAYAPVAQWLRADPLRAGFAQLTRSERAAVAAVLPEALVNDEAIRYPLGPADGRERRNFYDALNTTFARAAKPLLLVVDDLQWCDDDTFEWLHTFFHADLEGGVLLIATVRSDEMDRDHPVTKLFTELAEKQRAREISLQPLTAEETAELGRQISAAQVSTPDLQQLHRTTEGNPLFVIETVRAGLDDASRATPPAKVRAVILSRFGQLTPLAYELTGVAAAIGQPFDFDLVLKATDWDEHSTSRALDELWHRRVIDAGAGGYDFTHDLLREVAYNELSPVRKRFLHRRIARALEEAYNDDLEAAAGRIAAHYAAAAMAEQAIRFHRIAANAARQRYADRDAASELRHAVALCRELPDTTVRRRQELELQIALNRTLVTTLGYAAQDFGDTATRALELFRELRAVDSGVPVLSSAWIFHVVRANFATAKQLGQELLALATEDSKGISALAANFVLASVEFHLGAFETCRRHFETVMQLHPACSREDLALFATPEVNVFCRAYLSHVLWHLGATAEAIEASRDSLALAATTHPFGLAIAQVYAALLYVFQGEPDHALAHAEQARAVCSRYGIDYYSSMADIIAGWARAVQGTTAEGIAQLRSGIDNLRATGVELRLPFYYGLLGDACARTSNEAEALANISNGLAYQTKNGELWAAPWLHLMHGEILLRFRNRTEAMASFQRAFHVAEQLGARSLQARATERISQASYSAV